MYYYIPSASLGVIKQKKQFIHLAHIPSSIEQHPHRTIIYVSNIMWIEFWTIVFFSYFYLVVHLSHPLRQYNISFILQWFLHTYIILPYIHMYIYVLYTIIYYNIKLYIYTEWIAWGVLEFHIRSAVCNVRTFTSILLST